MGHMDKHTSGDATFEAALFRIAMVILGLAGLSLIGLLVWAGAK